MKPRHSQRVVAPPDSMRVSLQDSACEENFGGCAGDLRRLQNAVRRGDAPLVALCELGVLRSAQQGRRASMNGVSEALDLMTDAIPTLPFQTKTTQEGAVQHLKACNFNEISTSPFLPLVRL
jgi:hypothetical protein